MLPVTVQSDYLYLILLGVLYPLHTKNIFICQQQLVVDCLVLIGFLMMSSSDYFDIFENWGTNTNLTFDWDENQRPLMSASDKRLA